MFFHYVDQCYLVTGLQKLGNAAAFINFHLKSKPLAHSINASDAKVLIVGQG